jgi:hypothetical protein
MRCFFNLLSFGLFAMTRNGVHPIRRLKSPLQSYEKSTELQKECLLFFHFCGQEGFARPPMIVHDDLRETSWRSVFSLAIHHSWQAVETRQMKWMNG